MLQGFLIKRDVKRQKHFLTQFKINQRFLLFYTWQEGHIQ